LISGNAYAISDFNAWSSGLIKNNYIGSDVSGTVGLSNTLGGISSIIWSTNDTISQNVISGNGGDGISLSSYGEKNIVITGNRIGTTADGIGSLPNSDNGILIKDAFSNFIGGSTAQDANIIANNLKAGIEITDFDTKKTTKTIKNVISKNSIYNNGTKGISLLPNGNNLKTAPTILYATSSIIYGNGNNGDTIEVFSTTPAKSGKTQGKTYIKNVIVSGGAWSLSGKFAVGDSISATATDTANGTSEFSLAKVVSTSGPAGEALDFDGVKNYVTIPANAQMNFDGSSSFTLECWVKLNGTNTGAIAQKSSVSGANGSIQFSLEIQSGKIVCYTDDLSQNGWSNISTTNAVVKADTWTHIAFVFSSVKSKSIYVNGILQPATLNGIADVTSTSVNTPWNIGKNGLINNTFFKGQMDELRFWNRALTGCEIKNNMGASKLINKTELIAQYNFNQGTAGGVNTSQNLIDSSGANHGTLYYFDLKGNTSNFIAPGAVKSDSVAPAFINPIIGVIGNKQTIANYSYSPVAANGTLFGARSFLTRAFYLKNIGTDTLKIASVQNKNLVFTTVLNKKFALPNDSILMTISFLPTSVVAQRDTIFIYSNDCQTPVFSFSISGRGLKPVVPVLTRGDHQVLVDWEKIAGVTEYTVFYGTDTVNNLNSITISDTASSSIIKNLLNDTTYYIAIAPKGGLKSSFESVVPKKVTITFDIVTKLTFGDKGIVLNGFTNDNDSINYSLSDSSLVKIDAQYVGDSLVYTLLPIKNGKLVITATTANGLLSTTKEVEVVIPPYAVLGKKITEEENEETYFLSPVSPDLIYKWTYKAIKGKDALFVSERTNATVTLYYRSSPSEGVLTCEVSSPYYDTTLVYSIDIKVYEKEDEIPEINCDSLISSLEACSGNFIQDFQFEDIKNSKTGCSGAGYGDFTKSQFTTQLHLGSMYNGELHIGKNFVAENSRNYIGIWIDYNNNGNFDDPNEFLYSTYTSDTIVSLKNILISSDSRFAGEHRMRVKVNSSGVFIDESCVNYNESGETEDYKVTLLLEERLEAPVLITPNDDGKNDYFIIKGIKTSENNSLVIFNRAGNIVYKKENYDNTWSGESNSGKKLISDTYFYNFINGSATLTGYFELRY